MLPMPDVDWIHSRVACVEAAVAVAHRNYSNPVGPCHIVPVPQHHKHNPHTRFDFDCRNAVVDRSPGTR